MPIRCDTKKTKIMKKYQIVQLQDRFQELSNATYVDEGKTHLDLDEAEAKACKKQDKDQAEMDFWNAKNGTSNILGYTYLIVCDGEFV